jgi:mannan endo-1,4-beta-mannosidase
MLHRICFRPLARLLLCLGALSGSTGKSDTLLGVYYGDQGWAMSEVSALEAWQGKKHAVVTLFTDWTNSTKIMNNLFGMQLPNIWKNGNVPLVTWEPFTGGRTPAEIEARIAAGQYDAYIKAWAGRMKTFLAGPDGALGNADDRRAYIRLAHEMNGNWYPWSAAVGGNDPASFVAMWQRVVTFFDQLGLGAGHLQWIWCVNNDDVGGFPAEQFYPGHNYVDWVAIDGYNWGGSEAWSVWKSPAQTYDAMLARVRLIAPAKPIALTEFASTTAGGDVVRKSQWITDLFAYVSTENIKLISWFNEDKETDWAFFGGAGGDEQFKSGRTTYRSYKSYRTAVGSENLIPSQASNPRLVSDAAFNGY